VLEAVEEMRRIGLLIHVVSRTMRFEYDLDKEVVMKRGPKLMLVSLGATFLGVYAFWFVPRLYPNATLRWIGPHARFPGYADVSYQGVTYLWIGLGVALIAFTVYSLWRAPSKKPQVEAPGWACPHCHEVIPANFNECWKCQRVRKAGPSSAQL
jgi:hypothetical protein